MEGMRIAVTGATGFIGRRLCARLGDRRTWTALGRTDPAKYALPVAFRRVDLASEEEVRAAIPKGTDVLVHLAAYRGSQSDVDGHFRVTAEATLRLCAAARRAGVRRIVLGSTTAVYEPALPAGSTIDEQAVRARFRPLPKAFFKKWAEDAALMQCMLATPPMCLWVLRPGLVVGPGLRRTSWLRTTLARLRAGEPYPLTGDRGHYLGLVALEDVVDALAVAIGGDRPEGTEAPGPVWNLVGEPWWERDVVEALADALGMPVRFEAPPAHDPFGWSEQPLSVAGDGARWIREMGGLKPRPVAPLLAVAAREELAAPAPRSDGPWRREVRGAP
jgi:nucleoside-diphosphate-sugar epimerase